MKNKIYYLGGVAGLIGITLSRIMAARYGANSRVTFIAIGVSLLICGLVILTVMKKYHAAFITFLMVVPLDIMYIEFYLDNLYIAILGLTVFPISISIGLMISKKIN